MFWRFNGNKTEKIWGRSSRLLTDGTEERESGRTDRSEGSGGWGVKRSSILGSWWVIALAGLLRLHFLQADWEAAAVIYFTLGLEALCGCPSQAVCPYSLDLYSDFPASSRRPGTWTHINSDGKIKWSFVILLLRVHEGLLESIPAAQGEVRSLRSSWRAGFFGPSEHQSNHWARYFYLLPKK